MLKELIYNHYRKGEHSHQAKLGASDKGVFFNPSSFSACKRQIYYKKTNQKPSNPVSAASYVKMDFGTVLHERIQAIIKRQGILIEAEKLKTVLFRGLGFRYKTDGIIILNNKRYVMEIKTTSGGGFRVIKDGPKSSDVIQMVLYTIFENVQNGVLLYVGRDNGHMEEYAISVGDRLYTTAMKTINEKVKELKILETDIKSGRIPRRDFLITLKNKDGVVSEKFQRNTVRQQSDWQCRYCQWHDLCWQKELEEIKNHSFFICEKFID